MEAKLSIMKIFLTFFVAMGIIVSLGDAGCEFEARQPWWPQKGCILNGKIYPFGKTDRTEDCHKCSCDKDGMECCSLGLHPFNYNKEKCKVIFDRKRCRSVVVHKDDPSKFCTFAAAS